MLKKHLKILQPGERGILLPYCPEKIEDFYEFINKYIKVSIENFSIIFHDSDGDECEIIDQQTYTGCIRDSDKKVTIYLSPKDIVPELIPEVISQKLLPLKYFKKHSLTLYLYYLDTKTTEEVGLDKGITLKEYAAWVDLPTGEVFYCGGGYPESSSETFIINPSSGTHTKLPDMLSPRHSHGIYYQDNYVYVFGGLENNLYLTSVMSKSERFNLSQGTWEALPDIESPRGDVSVSSSDNHLFIFGRGSKYLTDYPDNYPFLNLEEDNGGCSLAHDNFLYIFQSDFLKVYNLNTITFEDKIQLPGLKSWWSHCPPMWFEDSIYFVWWEEPGWICQYDDKKKVLARVHRFG
ncbi:hypothetical protein SteCoe_26284 [Stentor coeruleus]|uniref:Uncharacterized protein n=1 Tax=Stentor coeruleus TaxID=5963 RepID=A0A1R2BDA2_9CILI|nr:hypothetical protein SteCoe_26284 [Stentor coeruleus]